VINLFSALRDRVFFIFAVALTTAWAVFIVWYVRQWGWGTLAELEPVALASFIAAATGPVAALWLVLIVFAQQREQTAVRRHLADLGNEIQRSVENLEAQANALLELITETKRRSFLESRSQILRDLNGYAAVMAERLALLSSDAVDAAWARYGAGDEGVFANAFLAGESADKQFLERLAQAAAADPLAQSALGSYVRRYERLRLHEVEGGSVLSREDLEDSPIGQAYRLFDAAERSGLSQTSDVLEAAAVDSPIKNERATPQLDMFGRAVKKGADRSDDLSNEEPKVSSG